MTPCRSTLLLALVPCLGCALGGAPEQEPARRASRPKVLLIGIDGCRPDALGAARTPAVDALIERGAFSGSAQTCEVTSSGPSWTSLLTGTWPAKHGVLDNSFQGRRFDRYPHVFDLAEGARPELFTASFAHWAPIDEFFGDAPDVSSACDTAEQVVERAIDLLAEGDPDFLFLHLDDVDHAGHAHGYAPDVPAYLAAIEATDALIGDVMSAVHERERRAPEDWLVILTTDHGGSGTSHGRDIPEHRTIFLLVSGEAVAVGAIEPPPEIVDGAATALRHLGIELDPAWELDGHAVGLR